MRPTLTPSARRRQTVGPPPAGLRAARISLARRRGSVLVLVLWMIVIMGTMTLAFTSNVRNQTLTAYASRTRREAYWAARGGIEMARAVLLNSDLSRVDLANPPLNDPETWVETQVGDAIMSVQVQDEGARVNLNAADLATLMRLPAMTSERAESLMDWRDGDRDARTQGAEDDHYATLDPPYEPRNAPLSTIREVMRVRGWERVFRAAYPDPYQRFLGEDAAASGGGADLSSEYDEVTPEDARRLLECVTLWSATPEKLLAPDGREKLNLATASRQDMTRRVESLMDDEADAIIARRSATPFKSVLELLDVPPPAPAASSSSGSGASSSSSRSRSRVRERGGSSRSSSGRSSGSGSSSDSSSGSSGSSSRSSTSASTSGAANRLFTLERAAEVLDYFTTEAESSRPRASRPSLLNVNTAGMDALMALPSMTSEMAEAILQAREEGPFESPAALARVDGMSEALFRRIHPLVMTTSSLFRVRAFGRGLEEGAAGVSIEAIVEVEKDEARVLLWREF